MSITVVLTSAVPLLRAMGTPAAQQQLRPERTRQHERHHVHTDHDRRGPQVVGGRHLRFDSGGAERPVDCGSDREASFFANRQRDELAAGVVAARGSRARSR